MKPSSPFASRVWWAFALDFAFVLVFVLIGRRSHDESDALTGIAVTLWPFFAGTVIGWLGLVGFRWPTVTIPSGVLVWVATVFVGMLLRVQSGQGIATSFVIVASVVLGVFLIGWRALAMRLVARRTRSRD